MECQSAGRGFGHTWAQFPVVELGFDALGVHSHRKRQYKHPCPYSKQHRYNHHSAADGVSPYIFPGYFNNHDFFGFPFRSIARNQGFNSVNIIFIGNEIYMVILPQKITASGNNRSMPPQNGNWAQRNIRIYFMQITQICRYRLVALDSQNPAT